MVANLASAASNQLLQKIAKQEVTNLSRQQWSSSSATQESAAQAAGDLFVSTETASTTLQQFIEILTEMMGGVSASVRRVFTSFTTFLGGHAAVSGAPGAGGSGRCRSPTGFSQDQKEALQGIVKALHEHHTEELSEAHKRTMMLCGVTGIATLSAAALAAWYISSSSSRNKSGADESEKTSEEDDVVSSPIKIKTLNFKGNPQGLVSLLDKLKESKTPVEIEHASVSDGEDFSSFEQHVEGEAPCSPALAGENSW